jgi:hypothetical protein
MVMNRAAIVLILLLGCNKPSEESCRKAISNMRGLLGTESATTNSDSEGDVRRCKGGSSKAAVECAAAATTIEELEKCEFMKIPAKEERCKKAIANAHTLRAAGSGAPSAEELKECTGHTTRKQIECAIDADSRESLDKCEFMMPPM